MIDQVKAPIKKCNKGCWDKINDAVDQRSQQLIQQGDKFKMIIWNVIGLTCGF